MYVCVLLTTASAVKIRYIKIIQKRQHKIKEEHNLVYKVDERSVFYLNIRKNTTFIHRYRHRYVVITRKVIYEYGRDVDSSTISHVKRMLFIQMTNDKNPICYLRLWRIVS